MTLFEKSAGPGGRMSTRYADPYRFDHGAQFFTAGTNLFKRFLEPLISDGVVAPWRARFVEFHGSEIVAKRQWDSDYPHYIGTPGMNAIGKYLAKDLDVRLNTKVDRLAGEKGAWQIETDDGAHGPFDWVITTAPAAQASALLPVDFEFAKQVSNVRQLGCYALMLGFDRPLAHSWEAALVKEADISWISINSNKPGRGDHLSVLVHATNAWAEAHMNDDIEDVKQHMLAEVKRVTGIETGSAVHVDVNRWRYANIEKQDGAAAFIDHEKQLIASGDWCVRGRVEAAFISATAAVEGVLSQ